MVHKPAADPVEQARTSRSADVAPQATLRIEPVGPDQWGQAMALIDHEHAAASLGTVPRDLEPGDVQAADHDALTALTRGLWMARRGDQPTAVVSVLPAAGRTAMVFVSTRRGEDHACGDAARLVREACSRQPRDGVRLFQALLRPQDVRTRSVLEAAGFAVLADLTYMQRRTPRVSATAAWPADLGLLLQPYERSLRDDFAHAIEASYAQTLDCPALVGMREMEDVLDGHMGAGEFHPSLWLLLREAGRPVGVLLMSLVHEGRAAELVYLGLAPSARGRRIGRSLLEHGMTLARQHGAERMLLAVDQRNTPALRLYASLRFVAVTRRTAMVMGASVSSPDAR